MVPGTVGLVVQTVNMIINISYVMVIYYCRSVIYSRIKSLIYCFNFYHRTRSAYWLVFGTPKIKVFFQKVHQKNEMSSMRTDWYYIINNLKLKLTYLSIIFYYKILWLFSQWINSNLSLTVKHISHFCYIFVWESNHEVAITYTYF